MLTTYVIDNTGGTLSFTINPGELDGPGGTQRHSDMRLYGNGALRWGEAMDENVLRLAETFACASKKTGDYNPLTGFNDFDASAFHIRPKDENDLGAGMGISQPLNGQLWYCTDTKEVYVYDEPNDRWTRVYNYHVGDDPPATPSDLGDLWYDLSDDFDECGGVLDRAQLKVYDPTHPKQENGWVSAGANYLNRFGDWMEGILDMGGDSGYYASNCLDCGNGVDGFSGNRIVNLGTPVCLYDAATKKYVDEAGSKAATDVEGIAEILESHLQNRAGRVPTEDTTLVINNRTFNFVDNTHLQPNEETMLRSFDDVYTAGNNTRTPAQVGQDIHTVGERVLKIGDTMTGWLDLKSEVPNWGNSWRAVPVTMLQDHVASAVAPYNRKYLYWDEWSVNVGGVGTSPGIYTFRFNNWITDYRSRTGDMINANSFRVIVFAYPQYIKLANPSGHAGIEAKYGKGTYGHYPYVYIYSKIYNSDKSTTGVSYWIQMQLGSMGWLDQGSRNASYSTGTPTSWRLVFMGGKNSDMIKYYNIPNE